ncbi:MAG: hypothetical protein C4338_00870 [Rhodanobacteraceae bacterium]
MCARSPRFIYGAARNWRAALQDGELRHHHVRSDNDTARFLSGNGTGLVLSGGGARDFAQIGVIQALREAAFQIESVIGTSIGAIVGAGVPTSGTIRKCARHIVAHSWTANRWPTGRCR